MSHRRVLQIHKGSNGLEYIIQSAGQPLVETPQDAIDTWKKSDIHVLWFPEARRMYKSSSLGD